MTLRHLPDLPRQISPRPRAEGWALPIGGLLLAGLLASWQGMAIADDADSLNVVAGVSYRHDDNLFRLPAGQNTAAATGRTERWDNIRIASAGLHLDQPYSLQRFKVDLQLSAYRFENFNYLNFEARDYKAAWLWALTPYLKGTLAVDRKQQLNDFRDYRAYGTANIRTTENRIFEGDLSPYGNWHLLAGLRQTEQSNSQVFQEEADFTMDALQGGVKYQFPSGSTLTVLENYRQGSYRKRALDAANRLDTGYEERETEGRLEWLLSARSRLNLRATYLNRAHDHFDQRDYEGATGRIEYLWMPTAKLNFQLAASRDLSSYQTSTSSYSQYDALNLTGAYLLSSKVRVSLNGNLSERKYLGNGVASGPVRVDHGGVLGMAVDWTPLRSVKVGGNVQQSSRSSQAAGADYTDRIAEVTLSVLF